MRTGSLPRDWVSANVVPVFKRDKKDVVNNYRHISLTLLVVKTMERIIFDKISGVLHEQKLISLQQYGFRKSRSTSHLLLEVVND